MHMEMKRKKEVTIPGSWDGKLVKLSLGSLWGIRIGLSVYSSRPPFTQSPIILCGSLVMHRHRSRLGRLNSLFWCVFPMCDNVSVGGFGGNGQWCRSRRNFSWQMSWTCVWKLGASWICNSFFFASPSFCSINSGWTLCLLEPKFVSNVPIFNSMSIHLWDSSSGHRPLLLVRLLLEPTDGSHMLGSHLNMLYPPSNVALLILFNAVECVKIKHLLKYKRLKKILPLNMKQCSFIVFYCLLHVEKKKKNTVFYILLCIYV